MILMTTKVDRNFSIVSVLFVNWGFSVNSDKTKIMVYDKSQCYH